MRHSVGWVLLAVAFAATCAFATDVSGPVTGTWTKDNSPYFVVGDVNVPSGGALTIEAGVEVNFFGYFRFDVDPNATLRVVGAESDSVRFTTFFPDNGWPGLVFNGPCVNCLLDHAVMEYSDLATITVFHANIIIRDSHIRHSSGQSAIHFSSAGGAVVRTTLSDNEGAGVWCEKSTLALSGCRILRNSFYAGVYISGPETNAVVENCEIAENSYGTRAHGIEIAGGHVVIRECDIHDNNISHTYASGGGIYVGNRAAEVQVIGCAIYNNSATYHGGGLYVAAGTDNVLLESCRITGNDADHGGGVYLGNGADVEIADCLVAKNTATHGGGLYTYFSDPQLCHCTFSGNEASRNGGAIYLRTSDATIRNSILWNDFATNGQNEISPAIDSNALLSYTDIEDGWPGQGNLNSDPLFVDPGHLHYNLRIGSPCIDAGDLYCSSPDPDGTPPDLGKRDLYFRQVDHVTVALYPHDTPLTLPASGGTVHYGAWASNPAADTQDFDAWLMTQVPTIGGYGPLLNYFDQSLAPGERIGSNGFSGVVPGNAPAGEYRVTAYVGEFGGAVIDSSSFTFTKLAP